MQDYPPPKFRVSSVSGSRDSRGQNMPPSRARNSQTLSRGRVKRKIGSKILWFAGTADFVKEVEILRCVQLLGGEPSKLPSYVRYDLLQALCAIFVTVLFVAKNSQTISNAREDKGVDYGGQERRGDLVAHVGQADKNIITLFDKGGYMRVPREILVEQDKISHRGALTHCVLAEWNGGGSHTMAILTRTKGNELGFFSAFIFWPWERNQPSREDKDCSMIAMSCGRDSYLPEIKIL